jgi:hypothetical protein
MRPERKWCVVVSMTGLVGSLLASHSMDDTRCETKEPRLCSVRLAWNVAGQPADWHSQTGSRAFHFMCDRRLQWGLGLAAENKTLRPPKPTAKNGWWKKLVMDGYMLPERCCYIPCIKLKINANRQTAHYMTNFANHKLHCHHRHNTLFTAQHSDM